MIHLADVTFPCPRCGRVVSVRNNGAEILHDMPPCERWLSVQTLADAAELLREHNDGIERDLVAQFPIEMSDERKAEFLDAAKRSGMRETSCDTCGVYLLTRSDEDRCPPCRRELAAQKGSSRS
jgi:predicted RNA-binding Zn-ribbon protein involved in translation (DUF1610 family)